MLNIFKKIDADYIEYQRAYNLKYLLLITLAIAFVNFTAWIDNEVPMFPIRFNDYLDYYNITCSFFFIFLFISLLLKLSSYYPRFKDIAIWSSIWGLFIFINIFTYVEIINGNGVQFIAAAYICYAVIISIRIPIFITFFIANGIALSYVLSQINGIDYSVSVISVLAFVSIGVVVFYIVEKQRQEVFIGQKLLASNVKELNRALDIKTVFFGHIIHELRTPLNAIIGFSEMVLKDTYQPKTLDKNKEYMGFINSSGNHLMSLVNDILDSTKIESDEVDIHMEKIDLGETLQRYIDQLGSITNANEQQVRFITDDDIIEIDTDRRILKQIIFNLISNAQKFTPTGGHIEIFATKHDTQTVEIIIKDNGKGMTEEILNSVNNPLSSMESHFITHADDTGFGLIIVRQLVQLLHGSIHFKSELSKGTEAKLILPTYQH